MNPLPLTPLMIKHLRLAKEIERQRGDKFYTTDFFRNTLGGLVRRGYVEARMIRRNEKRILGICLTETANRFLSHLETESISQPDG